MSVWFTSDLHFGHLLMSKTRCFNSMEDHDLSIAENINKVVRKKDKLYILGDLAFTETGLSNARLIQCTNIELILGNHDKYSVEKYLTVVQKIRGFCVYKDYWLSHCPIHPNEMRSMKGNLHGHIHNFGDTQRINDKRYFCVNPEFHGMYPISFTDIEKIIKDRPEENFSYYSGTNKIEDHSAKDLLAKTLFKANIHE